jgi:hypothetical protein
LGPREEQICFKKGHGESSVAEIALRRRLQSAFDLKSVPSKVDSPHRTCISGQTLRRGTINEIVSKHFKFSENFRSILIETAQKREQAVQAGLLGCGMRR